ncbi:MAG: hypothetical protein HYX57_09750 [Chloroflexi bacterium]|nr:hypothetical protein [Chloroflexota bacterium]
MTAGMPRRLAAMFVLGIALIIGGCVTTTSPLPTATATPGASASASAPASGTPAPDPIEVYRSIATQVEAIRNLRPATSIDPKIIDPATLQANITAEFDKSNPADQIRITERVYQALGLFPADKSLRDVYLALQGSQVIGYYDPSVDELFIVSRSGSLGPTERVTYAHEFTHQLQDGTFDLESLGMDTNPDQGDRNLSVLGLVEGDAVSVQASWMQANLGPAELAQIAAEASDPAMLEIMANTPAILLEAALFPYTAGATFASDLLAGGGYAAVDAAYGALPASTEQVIHPDKYLAREAPIKLTLPANFAALVGTGATLDAQDTLGELQLRVWLKVLGVAGDQARGAAEGWGGDRVGLLRTSGGDVLVLSTAWDTAADATEFKQAASIALGRLPGTTSIVGVGSRVAIVIGVGLAVDRTDPILRALVGD